MGSSAKERENVTGHVDKSRSFAELSARERLGEDYTIGVVEQDSPVAIFAPHGGKIEPGTSEIVRSIAAEDYNFYAGGSVVAVVALEADLAELLGVSSMTRLASALSPRPSSRGFDDVAESWTVSADSG